MRGRRGGFATWTRAAAGSRIRRRSSASSSPRSRLPGRTSASYRGRGEAPGDGVDKAGRRQYLYHPEFRAQQEQAKFDSSRLRRAAPGPTAGHGRAHARPDDCERCARVAVRLINSAGSASARTATPILAYARRHDALAAARSVAGPASPSFPCQARVQVRTTFVDTSRPRRWRAARPAGGARLFRYGAER